MKVQKITNSVIKKAKQLTFKFPKKKPQQTQLTFKFPKPEKVGKKLDKLG